MTNKHLISVIRLQSWTLKMQNDAMKLLHQQMKELIQRIERLERVNKPHLTTDEYLKQRGKTNELPGSD